MVRNVFGAALFLAAWAGGALQAGDKSPSVFGKWTVGLLQAGDKSPSVFGKPTRYLSLAEARATCLERGSPAYGIGLDNTGAFIVTCVGEKSSRPRVLAQPSEGAEAGILVARPDSHRPRAEFERNVNQMLLNVETAYWNLYGSYWNLYSREQAMRFAHETWKTAQQRQEDDEATEFDVTQAHAQYELFRAQRLVAIDTVLDNERQLRALMGIPIDDGKHLVPCDAPTLVACHPDWDSALHEALAKRPELWLARHDVMAGERKCVLGMALEALTSCAVEDCPVLSLLVPFHFRKTHDVLRLQLCRSRAVLRDHELKTQRFLALQFRRIASFQEQIKAQRAQREAFGRQLVAANRLYADGKLTEDRLLEAQRFWADALANEFQAIVSYNNALNGFEYARGTMLKHAHITITEAAPEDEVAVRAVERERQRTRDRVCREERLPDDALLDGPVADDEEADELPESAPTLPALWKSSPPMK